jgi:hypothetical protein
VNAGKRSADKEEKLAFVGRVLTKFEMSTRPKSVGLSKKKKRRVQPEKRAIVKFRMAARDLSQKKASRKRRVQSESSDHDQDPRDNSDDDMKSVDYPPTFDLLHMKTIRVRLETGGSKQLPCGLCMEESPDAAIRYPALDKTVCRLSRHRYNCHRDDPRVREHLELRKTTDASTDDSLIYVLKRRLCLMMMTLNNLGTYLHNVNVLILGRGK